MATVTTSPRGSQVGAGLPCSPLQRMSGQTSGSQPGWHMRWLFTGWAYHSAALPPAACLHQCPAPPQGLKPRRPGAHRAAVLCFMVGPLGLLCHLATKAALRWWRGRGRRGDDYVVYRF